MSTDPAAAADALVAAIDPGLDSPGVRSLDVVLVAGPWVAGVTSLAGVLRERLPDYTFIESDDLVPGDAPAAVVFAVSAAAPMTESDCALVELVADHTDLVIGAVTKIDTHQDWRDVLAADRTILAARTARFGRMPWVGVAAAPDLGEPQVDEIVGLLGEVLADPDAKRRNRLRAWETRLESVIARYRADGAGEDREARVAALRKRRDEVRQGRRETKSERTIAVRSQIQQARVQLSYFARNRCASVRSELQEDVADLGRHKIAEFEPYVRRRAADVITEVDEGVTAHLAGVANELELAAPAPPEQTPAAPEFPAPPLKSRRLETRLMMLLGAGFGLGVALAISRLFAGLAPGLTVAGLVAGGVIGLLLTVWVVGIRGLLHDRAVLDRWVGDVMTTLRSTVEELVATRVLAAETAFTRQLSVQDQKDIYAVGVEVAEIDDELREHTMATTRAAALRDRRVPPLEEALTAVRLELYGPAPVPAEDGDAPDPGKPVSN